MNKIITISLMAIVLSITPMMFEDAFAVFSTTQPNAHVSYNSDTNEVQVEWDFTTGGVDAPETCLVKGDFWFFTDLNNAYDTSPSQSNDPSHQYYDHLTRITGFIPIHYSVVSSIPVTTSVGTTEVIPCTGTARIDIDIVMSHPSNVKLDGVTPHEDLQIFLSFYAIDGNTGITLETFNFHSGTFMDQVFVFYTPNDTWSDVALDYACNGEIGNVLYLDQSGIHGNNGDNCDVYIILENSEYVDIGMDDDPILPQGQILYGDHVAQSFPLVRPVIDPSDDKKKKSAGTCSDCTAPDILIETEIIQNTEINKPNTISFSLWEDKGPYYIQLIEIGLGVKDVESSIENSQARIQVWMGYWLNQDMPVVKEITVIDPDGIFVTADATVTLDEECEKPIFSCLKTQFHYEYAKEPNYDGIIINTSDFYKNSVTEYFLD